MEFTNTITITMNNNASAQEALNIAKAVLKANAETFNNGYRYNPSESLANALTVNGNIIEVEDGFFTPEDILEVIKAMANAIAEELKDDSFSGNVYTSSTYAEDEIEISFSNRSLNIKDTYYPCGYTEYLCCEECGEEIVRLEDFDPNATYYCPECGEEIDLRSEYEECAPVITETTINI